jgi:hypothetical protein
MSRSIVKFLLCIPFVLLGQPASNYRVDRFPVSGDSVRISFLLTQRPVFPSSIAVTVDSVSVEQFRYDRYLNTVTLSSATVTSDSRTVAIAYYYLPVRLDSIYRLRSITMKGEKEASPRIFSTAAPSNVALSNLFGPELSKTGSINRGFLVGTNRDFSISSGFRLQMVGKLTDEIDITAALTDENTPIQPQGNTQTLQEIDNVFVEIASPNYSTTLGDFVFSQTGSEFFTMSRKLQGARVTAAYPELLSGTAVTLTGATARGKFNSARISGVEGVQGPYRLTGRNNERNIIIIAGSEKVYVDGELMVRGENNDYTIDYGSSEIIFAVRRMITGASRIVVDYEYSDRQYTRNFVGVHSETAVTNSFTIQANYFRESDDPDAPIDIILTDEDRALLSTTGNSTATKTGVFFVGTDSAGIGKGNYRSVDTVINALPVTFYRHEPGTPFALFNVVFSSVGEGNGDYIREGIGRYSFVGGASGNYSAVIIVPTPQLHQQYSIRSAYSLGKTFTIVGEFAASDADRNRLSGIGDTGNSGNAYKLHLRYAPEKIMISGKDFGSIDLSFSERFIDSRYTPIDRLRDVEFGRKWSTDSLHTDHPASEETREARMIYMPGKGISLFSGIGTLERGNQFSSGRYDGGAEFTVPSFPKISYYAEVISGDARNVKIHNDWLRQKGSAEYTFYSVTPSFRFENEERNVTNTTSDSLLSSSYEFISFSPKLKVAAIPRIDITTEYEWRRNKGFSAGTVIPQSSSFTHSHGFMLQETYNLSLTSMLTFRSMTYEPAFQSVHTNQQTTLMKILSRYRPFSGGLDLDAYYEVATQRTAALERVFYKVRKGEGQYNWVDANGNGIVDLSDENEFRPDRYDGEYNAIVLNSDNLRPVVHLKTSARIKIVPSRIAGRHGGVIGDLANTLSSESFLRLEERSTEQNVRKIYLFDYTSYLRPSTTLYGLQFMQHDLFLFENRPEYSFRFRFNQKVGLSQYSSGMEKNYSRERSVRTRFQISNDLFNQTDLLWKDDNAVSSSILNQTRQISSAAVVSDIAYKPETHIELGLKFETSRSEDRPDPVPVIADFNGQTIRIVYGFTGNGQIRSDFSREEVVMQSVPVNYSAPYELTSGRETGKQYLWSLSSEYRFTGNIQFSAHYNGRTTKNIGIVHSGRMELRAFF